MAFKDRNENFQNRVARILCSFDEFSSSVQNSDIHVSVATVVGSVTANLLFSLRLAPEDSKGREKIIEKVKKKDRTSQLVRIRQSGNFFHHSLHGRCPCTVRSRILSRLFGCSLCSFYAEFTVGRCNSFSVIQRKTIT